MLAATSGAGMGKADHVGSTPMNLLALAQRGVGALLPVGRVADEFDHVPALPDTRPVVTRRGPITVRYAEGPAGSVPVLLMHGVTWTADLNYHALFEALAEHHTVIGFDHRGHGSGLPLDGAYEMADLADDARDVLDALGIRQVIVVGFSLGALTSLHLALRHPERVAGFVPCAGTLCVVSKGYEKAIARVALPVATTLARFGIGDSWAVRYFGLSRQKRDDEFLQLWPWLRAELARTPALSTVQGVRAAVHHDLRGRVASLRAIPSVVVVLGNDGLIPPGQQLEMARELESGVVAVELDHDAPVFAPTAFRDAVLEAVAHLDEALGHATTVAG